jgi:hypothetical protein
VEQHQHHQASLFPRSGLSQNRHQPAGSSSMRSSPALMARPSLVARSHRRTHGFVLTKKTFWVGLSRMKAYFWWTETYFATATDHTCSNIISRDYYLNTCALLRMYG